MTGANDFGAVPVPGVAKGDEVWQFSEVPMPEDARIGGRDGIPVCCELQWRVSHSHFVQIAISAGASVTALLTKNGAVYACGYLRVRFLLFHSSGTRLSLYSALKAI